MTICWSFRYIWEKQGDARNQGDRSNLRAGNQGEGETHGERNDSEHQINQQMNRSAHQIKNRNLRNNEILLLCTLKKN